MAVKKLGDLTVEEATKELKKRGLDVNGDRNMLIARLRKALTGQRKPQATPVSADSNQTEKTQSSPAVDKTAPVAGAETVSQAPASPEKKLPKAEADPSLVPPPQEGGGERPAEEKVVEDPPLDLLADESQNDLDDDIVCVSMTPGRGYPLVEGSGGQKQAQKKSPEKMSPSKDSNIGSAFGGTSEQDVSKCDLSLWVSGLDSTSRAADLKTLFSSHGKVTGAKVVASAKSPDSKCFGIVTMATADDVENCIIALDGTSLQGKEITVELYSGHRKTVEKALVVPSTPTIWVTGISPDTKAPELKKLFVPHGRVVAATIVMNATDGSSKRCGLVKMSSCEEADLCIEKVNKMTLDGRVITVERAKSNRLPSPKSAGKASTRGPPALMSQKLTGGKASGSKPLSLLDPLLTVKENATRPARPRDRGRTRRGGPGARMGGRRGGNIDIVPPGRNRMLHRREQMMRLQHEQAVKAKEAELVRVLALEFDRQKQKEESERLAYEREQLEYERMRLEKERMEAERMRVQLEQERRQNEREQLERERARSQMLRNEQRMSMKRAAEPVHDESYYDYFMKKGRGNSPPPSSSQNLGRGPNMYENTNQRLQQMAHGAERRLTESRMKNSIPSGSSSSMGGRQMQGSSMYHRQSSGMDSSVDSGSKSEWKSLFNMSSGGSGSNGGEQNQWKSLSSSSLGRNQNDYSFSSSSSYGARPYPSNNSGFRGMKSQYGSGFKGGRGSRGAGGGGYKWR